MSTSDFISEEEWKSIASRLYNQMVAKNFQLVLSSPRMPSPYDLVDFGPRVDMIAVGRTIFPKGGKILTFEETFANCEGMDQLMSWGVSQFLPNSKSPGSSIPETDE